MSSSAIHGDENYRRGRSSIRGPKRSTWGSSSSSSKHTEDDQETDDEDTLRDEKRLRRDEGGDGLRRCTICKGTGHDRRNCSKFVLDSRGASIELSAMTFHRAHFLLQI